MQNLFLKIFLEIMQKDYIIYKNTSSQVDRIYGNLNLGKIKS